MQSLERLSIWKSRLGTEFGGESSGVDWVCGVYKCNGRLELQVGLSGAYLPVCLLACYKRIRGNCTRILVLERVHESARQALEMQSAANWIFVLCR